MFLKKFIIIVYLIDIITVIFSFMQQMLLEENTNLTLSSTVFNNHN